MAKIKKTTLLIEVTDSEFHVQYNGSLSAPETKEQFKHNERLMKALLSDERLFNFAYNIFMPVMKCKKREAKKSAESR